MKIKTEACPHTQLCLFKGPPEIKYRNLPSARNAYGNAAEKIAAEALGLDRISTDGRYDLCFDGKDREGNFYEIKSVKNTGQIIVWDWRLQKELSANAILGGGSEVFYSIVVHGVKGARTSKDLWSQFAATTKTILLIPLELMEVEHLLGRHTNPRTNKSHGSMRKGYKNGYSSVSLKVFEKYNTASHDVDFSVYGHPFNLTIKRLWN